MSRYGLSECVYRIVNDPESLEKFQQSPKVALQDCDLTELEREALEDRDLAKLHELGLHPLLIMQLALTLDQPLPWFQSQ